MESLLQKGVEKGLVQISPENKKIFYTHLNKSFELKPEEYIRAYTFIELVLNYGYKKENIRFEVQAQQGGNGETRADIVLNYPNKKGIFAVIEVKEPESKDKPDKIRKQARGYAISEEINARCYAYRIGINPMTVFMIKDSGEHSEIPHLPFDYENSVIYAYINHRPIPKECKHFQSLKVSSPHELKQIFEQCHNIIWNMGEKGDEAANTEFNKLLFLKMFDELKQDEKHLSPYFFQTHSTETKELLFERIKREYRNAKKESKVEGLLTEININKHQLYKIVKKIEGISLIATDNDPKGLAFETFRENHMKGDFGQFFTPRNIVDFMLKISPIIWDDNFRKTSKILDPCCGTGSFLIQAIATYKSKFPKTWKEFANSSVFGIELNDSISISAKINFALHDDGHDNVRHENGLNAYRSLGCDFDLILTNPPFGGQSVENYGASNSIDATDPKQFYGFEDYEITKKRIDEIDKLRSKVSESNEHILKISPQIIFFELYHKMLKVGGVVVAVVPDGLLTNPSEQYFRDWILEHFKILGVVSLPQFTFTKYGASVKSSVLIIKKLDYAITTKIQFDKRKYLLIAVQEKEKEMLEIEQEKKEIPNLYEDIKSLLIDQEEAIELLKNKLSDQKTYKDNLKQVHLIFKYKIDEIKKTDEYLKWKKVYADNLNDKLKSLKEACYDVAQTNFHKFHNEYDYSIFMAIAEHIGYDATGKPTRQNELDNIAKSFLEFIENQKLNN